MTVKEYKAMGTAKPGTGSFRKLVRNMRKANEGGGMAGQSLLVFGKPIVIGKQKRNNPEQGIQSAIIEFWERVGAVVVKINNVGIRKPDGSYIPPRESGVADLIIGYRGVFISLEVKAPGGVVSPAQNDFFNKVVRANCIAMIAWSIDDAIALKDSVDKMIQNGKVYA